MDEKRRRALVERYELVSDDQVLRQADPRAALADALASGESIEGILIAWGRQNPRAAIEHLDPFNGGYAFEKLFFAWSYSNPREAFEYRHEMAEVLVNSDHGDVRPQCPTDLLRKMLGQKYPLSGSSYTT